MIDLVLEERNIDEITKNRIRAIDKQLALILTNWHAIKRKTIEYKINCQVTTYLRRR